MSERERGRFIVLEGIDGSGTTTQAARLVGYLERKGRRAAGTREPSAGPVGRLLREILLGQHRLPHGAAVGGEVMALLFAADRRDHLEREIEPLLLAGTDVVSDRYLLSSLAYQAEETDRDWVAAMAKGVRRPDLTLLLDLPVETAARRRAQAGRPIERYDGDGTLAKVAQNYRRLARGDDGVRVIDGARGLDDVSADIAAAVDDFIVRGG